MKTRNLLGAALAALLLASTATYAADGDKPDTTPKTEAKPDTKNTRLVKPFSELKDLSADQTEKLKAIHRKYLDELHALEAKQHEESMAVLTDAQKKELTEIEAADKTARKTPAAAKPKADAKAPDAKTGGDAKDAK